MTRILVIEDDSDGQEVLTEFLRLNEFQVVGTGGNGLDAIKLYKKHKPDVTLMDFFMPEYDGIYGLTKIREFDAAANVIILSASADPDERNQMKKLGAVAVLTKPYDPALLVGLIKRFGKANKIETKQTP